MHDRLYKTVSSTSPPSVSPGRHGNGEDMTLNVQGQQQGQQGSMEDHSDDDININVNVGGAVQGGQSQGQIQGQSGGDDSASSEGTGSGQSGNGGNGEDRVTICHNGQTIQVAESAVQAHLDHGDTLGPCEGDNGNDNDDDDDDDEIVVSGPSPGLGLEAAPSSRSFFSLGLE